MQKNVIMKKGTFKNYKICIDCKIEYPLTGVYFTRKIYNKKEKFNDRCKKCYSEFKRKSQCKGNLLKCLICNKFLPKDKFSDNKALKFRNGKEGRCKKCKSNQSKFARIQKDGNEKINRMILERFLSARDRARRNGQAFSITRNDLQNLIIKQNYKCSISGIDLKFELSKGRVPENCSIDRIDSSKGYTNENIQLVCMAINQMKSDLKMEQLLFFCKKIIEKQCV